ncbi:hypothetical protein ACQCX5_09370 [Propionibacteriaceae bacterium G57]|uniref:hypothetical protein n=1 Tax=Aestuariimicrobium sp. G57 TaxID=3418485 RepID=UPI003DA753BD
MSEPGAPAGSTPSAPGLPYPPPLQQPTQQYAQQPAPHHPQLPIGPDGKKVIATLPPIDELEPPLPLSESTGQPRREPVMLIGAGLLYASSVAGALGFAKFWWDAINIEHFTTSARLMGWLDPRPGSWQSIVWVSVVALIVCVVVAAPALAAFQAWNGHRWSRIAGIVAAVLSALTILLNNWALPAIPLAVLGAAVLWLKPVGRYFDQWARFRADEPRERKIFTRVNYGRLPRYSQD